MSRSASGTSIIAMLLTALVATTGNAAGPPTTVGSCGQIVKGDAVLVNDLDCAPTALTAVMLMGGSLDLNGFTIRGAQATVYCAKPIWEKNVFLKRNCKVSNGTIVDSTVLGISAKNLVVENLIISPAVGSAIGVQGNLELTNLSVQMPAPTGFAILDPRGRGKVEGSGFVVDGGSRAISLIRQVRIDGMTATNYADVAIAAHKKVDVSNASFSGGNRAIQTIKARVTNSQITGHGVAGITAQRMRVIGSTVTGNLLDLESETRPDLESTTCDTSNGWGVCSND
jgi:hypothetical protein